MHEPPSGSPVEKWCVRHQCLLGRGEGGYRGTFHGNCRNKSCNTGRLTQAINQTMFCHQFNLTPFPGGNELQYSESQPKKFLPLYWPRQPSERPCRTFTPGACCCRYKLKSSLKWNTMAVPCAVSGLMPAVHKQSNNGRANCVHLCVTP